MIPSMDLPRRRRTFRVRPCVIGLGVLSEYRFVGEYKTILHLVGVLTHGKMAKRLTDRAIDLMQDVQNLRKAVYEFVYLPTIPNP